VFHGSLLWAIDRTINPMGSRALRRWLLQPLLSVSDIQERQDTIQELVENGMLREDLQRMLRQIYDLERLAGRAGSGTASPRDLVSLADSLSRLPELGRTVAKAKSPYLKALQTVPPVLESLGKKLHAHLVERPALALKEGGLIRTNVVPALDEMRHQADDDEKWLANLEVAERERTGIQTLKVGYSKTFGYYISISRSKAGQVPEGYDRKQTLVNEERFITTELKDRESRILNARKEIGELEYGIFVELRTEAGEHAELIRQVAHAVAASDALAGLAELAVYQGYCCPEITEGREIKVLEGRHPVVEQSLPSGFFVPNSATLGKKPEPDLVVLTGPNASGKSCYLRQIGLIQLMAQIGSFVPAENAKLSVCDRIFTRVGAVDDLATGQSTFMVEMNETANILNHATERSLVLLDEIGRGTATFDGLSIAWAVAEHLATQIRARTIFATHYHELNELASILPNVANYQVTVKEMPDQIIFLHKVQPGGADRSYGIEAGRLAGLPTSVIDRARQVMSQIEKHSKIAIGLRRGGGRNAKETTNPIVSEQQQLDIFG
jgi:DNA mismatch repair protein MutS